MHSSQLLIVLGAAAGVWGATALLRRAAVPTPVVLVVAGVIVGFLPFVPDATLQPRVVLLGLLPLLVFHAALSASPRAFASQAPQIALLAVGLVVLTAAAVALAAHDVGHLSWAMSFVLGAAVGPTDAVAATSIAGRLGLPARLRSVLEGEALFNDVTALVAYAAAVTAATSGHFSAGHTAATVVFSIVVGAGIGLGVAIVGRALLRRLDDAPIEIVLTLLLAYAAYLPAEELGASGVLAAVTAGLYLGWHSSASLTARTRLISTSFWDTLVFLIDGALFILVGLSLHSFAATARDPLTRVVATAAVTVAAVVVVRLGWTAAMAVVLRPIRRLGGAGSHREQVVLGWSGMRGAVTLAAVLAVPVATDSGAPLAGRDDVVYLGFAVIFATLVGQGLTLPTVARRFRSPDDRPGRDQERQARLELLVTARRRLDDDTATGAVSDEVTAGLKAAYDTRIRQLTAGAEDPETHRQVLEEERSLRRELLGVQRRRLLELRAERRVETATLRAIERDLDLDEARLR